MMHVFPFAAHKPVGTWLRITFPKNVSTWRTHWAVKWSHESVGSETGGELSAAEQTTINFHWWRHWSWFPDTSIPPTGGELLCPICISVWRVGVWVSTFECLPSPPRCVSTHTQLALVHNNKEMMMHLHITTSFVWHWFSCHCGTFYRSCIFTINLTKVQICPKCCKLYCCFAIRVFPDKMIILFTLSL